MSVTAAKRTGRVNPNDLHWLPPAHIEQLAAQASDAIPHQPNALYANLLHHLRYPLFRTDPLPGPSHHDLPGQLTVRLDEATDQRLRRVIQPFVTQIVLFLHDAFKDLENRIAMSLGAYEGDSMMYFLTICGLRPLHLLSSAPNYRTADFRCYLGILDALAALDHLLDLLVTPPSPRSTVCSSALIEGTVRLPYAHPHPNSFFGTDWMRCPTLVAEALQRYREPSSRIVVPVSAGFAFPPE